jgi:hypothetical protein
MGTRVLQVSVATDTPLVRAYAHCGQDEIGVALVFINLDNETAYEVKLYPLHVTVIRSL